jgi:hypothetical protein
LFLSIDGSLILNLTQLSTSFIEHFLLEIAADLPITFTYLAEDVSLVGFLSHSHLSCFLCISDVLQFDLPVYLLLFVPSQPFCLICLGLLEFDVDFAMLINIFEEINARLVFSAPLSFSLALDFLVFNCSQIFDHFFIDSFGFFLLLIEALKSLSFFSSSLLCLIF